MKRFVIISIDDLTEILKDYLGQQYLPQDLKPTKFRIGQAERRLEIMVESDEWEGDQGRLKVDFQLKRMYAGAQVA